MDIGKTFFFFPLPPVKRESAPTPPPPKPAMTEEEVEKKSKAIIEEYLHINDSKVPTWRHTHFGLVLSGHLAGD